MLIYPNFSSSLMTINKETVKKISKLSRIASNEEFENSMIKDLNSILKFVEQLNELNISNTEPLSSVVDQKLYQRDDVEKKLMKRKIFCKIHPLKRKLFRCTKNY